MECQFQSPLTDEQIWDALDNMADDAVQDHIVHCESCRQRLEAAHQFESEIRHAVHPSPQLLVDFHTNLLDSRIEQRITDHVFDCEVCQTELRLLDVLADDVSIPAAFEAPAQTRPPISKPHQRDRDATRRIWTARLVLPNRGTGVRAAGIRVLGHSAAVVTAEADGLRIHMTMEAVRAGVVLSGQVITRDEADQPRWDGAVLAVTNLDIGTRAMTLLNDLGEFSCAALPAGSAYLRIRASDGQTIVLDRFPLADTSEKR